MTSHLFELLLHGLCPRVLAVRQRAHLYRLLLSGGRPLVGCDEPPLCQGDGRAGRRALFGRDCDGVVERLEAGTPGLLELSGERFALQNRNKDDWNRKLAVANAKQKGVMSQEHDQLSSGWEEEKETSHFPVEMQSYF
jgi:hypothetical protein